MACLNKRIWVLCAITESSLHWDLIQLNNTFINLQQSSSKVDVHCFLFTDVLLVCKLVTRKAERVKVIRPPCLVDRLVVTELTRDPAGLALIYLNELGTASAAFSLHAPEAKQSKVWLDHIRKAQELYRNAKLAAVQADQLYYEEEDDLDFPHSALLTTRSPRGSSRASRGSSLIHSHRYADSSSRPTIPTKGFATLCYTQTECTNI